MQSNEIVMIFCTQMEILSREPPHIVENAMRRHDVSTVQELAAKMTLRCIQTLEKEFPESIQTCAKTEPSDGQA